MEVFAKALKQDVPLQALLRERGPEFGVAAGSRLDQVARADELDWRLWKRLDVEQVLRPGMSRGPSMGM